jgi:DNA-binding MarR family transcriptional regulator
MDTLYGMPGHLIRRAQQISTALFADECAGFDLTSVQYAALHAIAHNAQVDATRLSALIAFDRSTIGDVLERMEAKGWIERTGSDRDRRIKLVRLSPAGEDLLRRVGPAVARVQQRLLTPLAEADREVLVRLLGQLAELHNEVTPAPLRTTRRNEA